MPLNGEGTYDGGAGSEPHAAARPTNASRTTARISFLIVPSSFRN
jgi:hypothetical protein